MPGCAGIVNASRFKLSIFTANLVSTGGSVDAIIFSSPYRSRSCNISDTRPLRRTQFNKKDYTSSENENITIRDDKRAFAKWLNRQ